MFKIAEFKNRITTVNKHFGRFKKSSLQPLLDELTSVNGPVPSPKKKAIQEIIFHIPGDKQNQYRDALGYLAQSIGVKICGRPTKPTMELAYFAAGEFLYVGLDGANKQVLNSSCMPYVPVYSYHHVFDFKFKSSTGKPDSLKAVGTREHVKFRVQPGGPPFNSNLADTPLEFFHGVNKTGANLCFGRDDHMTKPPSLICAFPLTEGELIADQWYQYTIDNGATWENIPGAAYNLIKGVRRSGNTWVFYFIKKNWTPHNTTPFQFEAEYKIHEPSPRPKLGEKLNKASGARADIGTHAHRVVRMR